MSNKNLPAASTSRRPILKNSALLLSILLMLAGCRSNDTLPILGEREAVTRVVDGKSVVDTVYRTIPDFRFASQYGDTITAKNTDGKIYVADFFFTTCPTICPKMKVQLKRVFAKYKDNPEVMILSHSIDPTHDTVPVLKEFAQDLGVTGRQWLFLTGDREKIYEIAENDYLVTAKTDSTAPGGVVHSGAFVLIDKARRIRGVYDGTTEEGVDRLMKDMDTLLAEYKK